jgi:hypothetical protein
MQKSYARHQNASQCNPQPELRALSHNHIKTPSFSTLNHSPTLSLILSTLTFRLTHFLIRIRTPRSPLPLSRPLSVIMIVIMSMSMPTALFPHRPCGPIIPAITITTRITRALITRLVDSFRSVVYAADYLLSALPLPRHLLLPQQYHLKR